MAQSTVTIWEEHWDGYAAGDKPSSGDNATYTYTDADNSSKLYTGTGYAGGESTPELLISKSGDAWTITIADLKGCSGTFTLSYMSNKKLTVTANSAAVEMTAAGNNYTGNFTLDDGTTALTIVITNNQSSNSRIDDIILTGIAEGGETPGLTVAAPAFSPKDETRFTGTLDVTLSSATADARIYYTLGETTDPTAPGATLYEGGITITETTTINAVACAEDADGTTVYSDVASATYTKVVPEGHVYRLVTAEEELVAGEVYLIANSDAGAVLGWQKSSNRGVAEAIFSEDKSMIISVPIASEKASANDYQGRELTLGGKAGAWTFYDKVQNGYLYTSNTSSNQLKTQTASDEYTRATIAVDASGVAQIVFTGINDRNMMQYNANSKLFACYGSAQKDVQLYRRYEIGDISIKMPEGYGTYYTDRAFVMPAGVTGTTVAGYTADGKLVMNWEYAAGTTVPAHTALLLKANAPGDFIYTITTTEEAAPAENLLKGSVEAAMTEGSNCYFYMLSYEDATHEKAGFYWGEADGAAFLNGANKAYLALPKEATARIKGFSFGEDTVTAITGVQHSATENRAIYTLSGVRVNGKAESLPQGIYIVGGKKFIVK